MITHWLWYAWMAAAGSTAREMWNDWHDPDEDRGVTVAAGFLMASLFGLAAAAIVLWG